MPRIADVMLRATVLLYMTKEAADRGEDAFGGSGVLVGQPCPESPDNIALYIVTCDHVATGGAPVARMQTASGRAEVEHRLTWVPHPNIAPDAVVAGFRVVPKISSPYSYVPLGLFATPADVEPRARVENATDDQPYYFGSLIGPGDSTVLIGRFLAQDGVLSQTPTVRFGNIASAGLAIVKFTDPKRPSVQDVFLIESRSLPGYSGSAVYMFHEQSTMGGLNTPLGTTDHKLMRFLGIDCAHMQQRVGADDKPIAGWEPAMAFPGKPRSAVNAGMMTVVPAWTIAEILRTPEIAEWTAAHCGGDDSVELDVLGMDDRVKIDADPEDAIRALFTQRREPPPESRSGDT